MSLITDPGFVSSIQARPYTFVEIGHKYFLQSFLPLIQERLLSVTNESICIKYWLTPLYKLAQEKKVARLTDCLDMTITVDWDVKLRTKQTKQNFKLQLRLKMCVLYR